MTVLVTCEYSGTVRDAIAANGHDAWSNDILPTHKPGNHIQGDCIDAMNSRRWDAILNHFPCTAIALSGNRYYGKGMIYNHERVRAVEWTIKAWGLACSLAPIVYFENPKNVMGAFIGEHSQSVHPWQFGHTEQKETWLWIRGLPPLRETNNVYDAMMLLPKKDREKVFYMSPGSDRGKKRSLTYVGFARAVASQWFPRPA